MPIVPTVRRLVTSSMIKLGPRNPLVRLVTSRACQRYGTRLGVTDDAIEIRKDDRLMRIAHKHFIYAMNMSEFFDTYFGQVVPEEKGGLRVVDYSRPRRHRYSKSGLEFELSAFPEEEEAIEGYFRWYRPQPGDVIFDLGAHCGISTYQLSKRVGAGGRVVAFEPDSTSHELLLKNIAAHDLTNVVPVRKAISHENGTSLFITEGTIGSTLSSLSTRSSVGTEEMVDTITLEEASRQYGIPSFIKMDIEGAEIGSLDASREWLQAHPVYFAIDTHHWVDGRLTSGAVEAIFHGIGYEAVSSADSGFMTTWARPRAERGKD